MNLNSRILTFAFIALLGWSCGDGGADQGVDSQEVATNRENFDQNASLLEIEGKIFSIPSPVQTAFLIREVGTTYDPGLLNDAKNSNKYSTSFKKAMNLGIYGADLGYVTIYEQTQDAIMYLTSVKKLANDLGVSAAFDIKLIQRFEQNIGNQDSMLVLVADAFRAADAYLKNNERSDVGSLILAGGWVESLYFTTRVAQSTKNDDVITRIGAQKKTCNNLVQLLMPHYNKEDYTGFIDQLMELNEVFKEIETSYSFQKPTTDAANKTTRINSTSEIMVSDEQLTDISGKIEKIRDQLIN